MASCSVVSRAQVESQVRSSIGLILEMEHDPDPDGLKNVALVAARRCGAQNVEVAIRCGDCVHEVQIEFGAPGARERLAFSVSKADAA